MALYGLLSNLFFLVYFGSFWPILVYFGALFLAYLVYFTLVLYGVAYFGHFCHMDCYHPFLDPSSNYYGEAYFGHFYCHLASTPL